MGIIFINDVAWDFREIIFENRLDLDLNRVTVNFTCRTYVSVERLSIVNLDGQGGVIRQWHAICIREFGLVVPLQDLKREAIG